MRWWILNDINFANICFTIEARKLSHNDDDNDDE